MLESLGESNIKRMNVAAGGNRGARCPDSDARLLLQGLAETTQQRIVEAHKFDLNYGETTITDFCLLEIARAKLQQIAVVAARGQMERKRGFDWEWYIKYPATKWFRFSVQAKKMSPETGTYRSLRHQVAPGEFQIDILAKFAALKKTIPLYAFYNVRKWAAAPPSLCAMTTRIQDSDCTLVPLDDVRKSHGVRCRHDYGSVHIGKDMPWRCIVCPGSLGACVGLQSTRPPAEGRSAVHPLQARDIEPLLLDRLPPVVERLVAGSSDEREVQLPDLTQDEAYANELGIAPRRIAIIHVEDSLGPQQPASSTPPIPETRAF